MGNRNLPCSLCLNVQEGGAESRRASCDTNYTILLAHDIHEWCHHARDTYTTFSAIEKYTPRAGSGYARLGTRRVDTWRALDSANPCWCTVTMREVGTSWCYGFCPRAIARSTRSFDTLRNRVGLACGLGALALLAHGHVAMLLGHYAACLEYARYRRMGTCFAPRINRVTIRVRGLANTGQGCARYAP